MVIQIVDSQTRVAHLNPLDKAQQPTTVDTTQTPVTWTPLDPANLTIEPIDNGLSAKLIPTGPLGSFDFTINADVNMDPGVLENVTETHTVEVIAGKATGLGLTLDEPVDKP